MLTEGGRSDRYGYVIQCNAAGERRLTNRCQCRREVYSLQIIAVLKGIVRDCGNTLRHSEAYQFDAAFEDIAAIPSADRCPTRRNIDRCKLLAVGKCPVSDCSDAVRQNNALQCGAAVEGPAMNDSQSIRKRDRYKADTACKCVLTKRGDRAGTENSLQRFIVLECACTDRSDRIPTQLLWENDRRVAAGVLCDGRLFGGNGISVIALLADQAWDVERCRCDGLNSGATVRRDDLEIICAESVTRFIETHEVCISNQYIKFNGTPCTVGIRKALRQKHVLVIVI